ncbi:MAG: hypothetical protein ACUVSY_14550 [Roseiflexus sp.]
MGVWQTLHRFLAQREIGLMWLLLFHWAALVLALAQSFLIEAERLPQTIPHLILIALTRWAGRFWRCARRGQRQLSCIVAGLSAATLSP